MNTTQLDTKTHHLLDQLSHTQHIEKQQIVDSFHEGVVLLSLQLKPLLINKQANEYLLDSQSDRPFFKQFTIYSQKRQQLKFNIEHWLQQLIFVNTPHRTPTVWLRREANDNDKAHLIPIEITVHPIRNNQNKVDSLLLLIKDQTLQIKAEAQLKLMEASYAGQFITDGHGYITQPNYAFSAYTGLKPESLETMTYIDWLKKQVVFRVPFGSVMEALLEEGCWSGEVELTPSKNMQYHAVLSLSMMTDSNRNIEHFIGVLQDITDIHEARSKIERLAYYDNLTGLANSTLLNNHLTSTLDNLKASQSFSALIQINIDSFKVVNETLGHSIGDQLLILISQHISQLANQEVLVARIENDIFTVLVKEVSQDYEEAQTHILNLAYQANKTLNKRFSIQNKKVHTTCSVGVYIFHQDEQLNSVDDIMRHSHLAMHEAKNLGGDQVYLFEEKLCNIAKQRLKLLQALNHSELDDEFELYFQPQIDSTGKTVAAETLLRWFHPTLGLVSPSQFIPVAEESRQIIKIGLWVMHKAFLHAKHWNEKLEDSSSLTVSINISPIQFHEQSFVELVIGLVKFTRVNPENITLELTEGVLIRNTDLALQKIQHLVSLGFKISIDDFGTGYSSLGYLQKLPIHELKIDQSFIRHIPENTDDTAIVESIIQLAQTRRINIVAEGVETKAQAEFIKQQSSDILIQGYLYGKPCSATDFEINHL